MSGIEFVTSIKKSHPSSDHNILCVCDKGVNRSTSFLITYGIMEKGINPNNSLQWIENEKYKVDRYWQSLTNLTMGHCLDKIYRNRLKELHCHC